MVSQELRLAGSADAVMNGFDWTVGVYYASEDIKLLNEFIWGSQGVISSNVKAYSASFDHSGDTTAVFGHGTLNLTERLSLTAGLRYTKDEKDATLVNDHPLVAVPFPPFAIPSVFPLQWFTISRRAPMIVPPRARLAYSMILPMTLWLMPLTARVSSRVVLA